MVQLLPNVISSLLLPFMGGALINSITKWPPLCNQPVHCKLMANKSQSLKISRCLSPLEMHRYKCNKKVCVLFVNPLGTTEVTMILVNAGKDSSLPHLKQAFHLKPFVGMADVDSFWKLDTEYLPMRVFGSFRSGIDFL